MYVPNEAELSYLRKAHDECSAFLTICGGFIPAQKAGILAGKTATAPRFMIEQLRKEDPRTNWVEKRWVRHGKVWTSGALLNGLDLMMAFVREAFGGEGESEADRSSAGNRRLASQGHRLLGTNGDGLSNSTE